MKTVLFALLFLSFSFTALAQSPDEYSAYEKEDFFSDYFLNNKNSWRQFYTRIKKGRFVIETIGKDLPAVSTIPIKLDESRNYEIETVVSLEWNRTTDLVGIVWNRDLNNGYYLGFNKENKLQVYIQQDDKIEILGESKGQIFFNMYEKRLLTIRKIDNEYLIYIDKILVFSIPVEHDFGDHLGYFVGKGSEIQAFSLTVSYLNQL